MVGVHSIDLNGQFHPYSPMSPIPRSSFQYYYYYILPPRQFSHLKFVSVVRRSAGLNKNEKCANGVLRRYLPLNIFKTQDGVRVTSLGGGKNGELEL